MCLLYSPGIYVWCPGECVSPSWVCVSFMSVCWFVCQWQSIRAVLLKGTFSFRCFQEVLSRPVVSSCVETLMFGSFDACDLFRFQQRVNLTCFTVVRCSIPVCTEGFSKYVPESHNAHTHTHTPFQWSCVMWSLVSQGLLFVQITIKRNQMWRKRGNLPTTGEIRKQNQNAARVSPLGRCTTCHCFSGGCCFEATVNVVGPALCKHWPCGYTSSVFSSPETL